MNDILHEKQQTQVMVNSFIQSVYNWMVVGLGITALTAYVVANSEFMLRLIFGNSFIFWGLIISELAIVFILAGRINRMEATTATGLFLFYSVLNGATLSCIFLAYTMSSITSVFVVCALTFGTCSVYGMVTKRDLTSVGSFMFMGLIGIIIASFVNIFFQSPGIAWIINYLGVFVFIGLTAYDTQQLKNMALTQPDGLDGAVIRKGAILGALNLYLDFINMFLFLLRIFGGSRD
jgi:FtsH-binding integral membrane protein